MHVIMHWAPSSGAGERAAHVQTCPPLLLQVKLSNKKIKETLVDVEVRFLSACT